MHKKEEIPDAKSPELVTKILTLEEVVDRSGHTNAVVAIMKKAGFCNKNLTAAVRSEESL